MGASVPATAMYSRSSSERSINAEIADMVATKRERVLSCGRQISDAHQDREKTETMHSAAAGGDVEAIRRLYWSLSKFPKYAIRDFDEHKLTPLHEAARNGHVRAIEVLVELGAVINPGLFCQWARDYTPLHLAAMNNHEQAVRKLKELGAEVNGMGRKRTPLHVAADAGHVNIIKVLKELGADLEARDLDGFTAMHQAAWSKKYKVIACLSQLGGLTSARAEFNVTPLHVATMVNSPECLEELLKSADKNEVDHCGNSALHYAVLHDSVAALECLLEHGASVEVVNIKGLTPLQLALALNRMESAEKIRAVTQNKETPSQKVGTKDQNLKLIDRLPFGFYASKRQHCTAVQDAAAKGNIEAIKSLLLFGVSPNATNYAKCHYKKTWLSHLIIDNCSVDAVEYLVRQGAEVDGLNEPVAPLGWAARSGNIEVMRSLLRLGANIYVKDKYGSNALHIAAGNNQVEALKVLFENGFEGIRVENDKGETPLHSAACSGSIEAIDYLVERELDINKHSKDGSTPLHKAAWGALMVWDIEIFKHLVQLNAELDAKDEDGNTPLHIAAKRGISWAMKALLELGANVNAVNNKGQTVLMFLLLNTHLRSENLAKLLLDLKNKHADFAAHDIQGETALHIAARRGYIEIFQPFIATENLDYSARNNDGMTALDIAEYMCKIIGYRDDEHTKAIEILKACVAVH